MKTVRIEWMTEVLYAADFAVADDFNIDRLGEAEYHEMFAEREEVDASCLGVRDRDIHSMTEVQPIVTT